MIQLTLPWPPSQNRLWRNSGKRVYRDPKYMTWLKEAGWVIKIARAEKIIGPFSASIILNPPDKRRIDIDNRVKGLLDLAQQSGLIEDDCLCRLLVVAYGQEQATPSALLTLKSMG